jgi:Methyltransferase domain
VLAPVVIDVLAIETTGIGAASSQHGGRAMATYYGLKQKLAPGLRFNQEIYEDTLAALVDGTTIWLDAGCGRHLLPAWRGQAEQALTLITSNMVAEHLQDPARAFTEFGRVLAPTGDVVVHTPNAWSYFVAASRWLPRGLRLWLVRRLDGRAAIDVFAAYYRANTVAKLRRLMGRAGLTEQSCRLVASDAVLGAVPFLAAIELLYIRLSLRPALRWLRVTILARYSKVAEAPHPERFAAPVSVTAETAAR